MCCDIYQAKERALSLELQVRKYKEELYKERDISEEVCLYLP